MISKMKTGPQCIFLCTLTYLLSSSPCHSDDTDIYRYFGIKPGEVKTFEQDPEVTAARESQFMRYIQENPGKFMHYAPDQSQEFQNNYETSSTIPSPYRKPVERRAATEPMLVFSMKAINRIAILFTLIVAIGCLSRAKLLNSKNSFISALQPTFLKVTFWPENLDPLAIIVSCGGCHTLLWHLPYTGQNALVLYLALVLPLCVFLITWQLIQIMRFRPTCDSDVYKRIAVSLAMALLALQFAFEPWPPVTIKAIILLPVSWLFLVRSSVLAYRLFLTPVAFSLLFSMTRLFGDDSFSYLAYRFALNGGIIYCGLGAFLNASSPPTSAPMDWQRLLEAGRAISPARIDRRTFNRLSYPIRVRCGPMISRLANIFGVRQPQIANSLPPQPPTRWFLYLNGEVNGPVLDPELKNGAAIGVWPPETPVCKEGSADWTRLDEATSPTA